MVPSLLEHLNESFYYEYENWEMHFDLWRRVYSWPNGVPSNIMFRRAILARVEWLERSFKKYPNAADQCFRLAIQDLQNPTGLKHRMLMIADVWLCWYF